MRKPVIEFVDFSFKYRAQAKPTLNNINLTIYEGEKVLIVGPSGSGKSTLSNCINGLVPFSYKGDITGSVKINGKETKKMSIFELSNIVGTVLQDPDSQFIGLTVGEDIAFKLENDCVSQEEMKEKVRIASKMVGIDTSLDSAPHRLSGGQKQRVTLAGVMVSGVDVLLFDEPLASLDPATGKSAIELIDDIQRQTNKTVIIIEHRLEDVLHCNIDRVIVVDEGVIKADITPDKLLESTILAETGIREPLYITALKYAGVEITSSINPQHIDSINMESCSNNLKEWYEDTKDEEYAKHNEPLLELNNVKFGYNEKKQILKDISFKINKGEMVSIVGRNGAGKSTISKLICGFYKPS
ncbi:MAG: ABC transporter ATP-binding protein, partial [Clostridium sp.]